LVYKTDQNELVAALVRGDHEINELKLQAVLGCREVALGNEAEIQAATNVAPGFLGPIGLKLRIVADLAIQGIQGAVTGANEADAHFVEVDQERISRHGSL
jgi:prolyl-tRNA synthetase